MDWRYAGGGGGGTGGPAVLGALLLMLVVLCGTPRPGAAAVAGDTDLCSVDCPRTWDPVCSTKQTTYQNTCFLFKSVICIGLREVREAYRGPCSPCVFNSPCPTYSDPVCGTDGHTYVNYCTLQATNRCRNTTVTLRQRGPCAPDPTSPGCRSLRMCHVLFMPVCASDGRTYGNRCELEHVNDCRLEADRISVVKDGECSSFKVNSEPCSDPVHSVSNPDCNKIHHPVCGADGSTYDNWRQLQEENDQRMDAYKVDMAYMGPCRRAPRSGACRPSTVCPPTREPVCGNNGDTYINHCKLFQENECREYRYWVHYLHDGSCTHPMGMGKAGTILMKITIVLVAVVIAFAIMVPLYNARRSHQLVTSWNNHVTSLPISSGGRGRYQLVATVGSETPLVSVIPVNHQ